VGDSQPRVRLGGRRGNGRRRSSPTVIDSATIAWIMQTPSCALDCTSRSAIARRRQMRCGSTTGPGLRSPPISTKKARKPARSADRRSHRSGAQITRHWPGSGAVPCGPDVVTRW